MVQVLDVVQSEGGGRNNIYEFKGCTNEKVPNQCTLLLFEPGQNTRNIPDELCWRHRYLREVIFPMTAEKIGVRSFGRCRLLQVVSFASSSIKSIGEQAFHGSGVWKVMFSFSTRSAPLEKVENSAFSECHHLQRVEMPHSLMALGENVFGSCSSLVEVVLATKHGLHVIPERAFGWCFSLQCVRLPDSLKLVKSCAFCHCASLVTVEMSRFNNQVEIETEAFIGCGSLSNILIGAKELVSDGSFRDCSLLHQVFGMSDDKNIVCSLISRFECFPVHRLCYFSSTTTTLNLAKMLDNSQIDNASMVDMFGMTPFHILFSGTQPREDLLEILIERCPSYLLGLQDANQKTAFDYLLSNWRTQSTVLLKLAIYRWSFDPSNNWRGKFLCPCSEIEEKYLELKSSSNLEVSSRARSIGQQIRTLLANDGESMDERQSRLLGYEEVHSAVRSWQQMELLTIFRLAVIKLYPRKHLDCPVTEVASFLGLQQKQVVHLLGERKRDRERAREGPSSI